MKPARSLAPSIALALLGTLLLPAQPLPAPGNPRGTLPEAARPMMKSGRSALQDGRIRDALHHFLAAADRAPDSLEVLSELLLSAADDADARALFSHRLHALGADARGRLKTDRTLGSRLASDDTWREGVARGRAEAIREIAGWASKLGGKGRKATLGRLLGRWLRRLAEPLLNESPALLRTHGKAFAGSARPFVPDHKPVLRALKEVMDRALSEGRTDVAIRAARILLGLASQAGFNDLEGPKPPSLRHVAIAARAGLARARQKLGEDDVKEPLTVEQLEAMSPEEQERFTREHASFTRPGVAVSPGGLYRIETSCGYETLLGAARTVELHHRRLAGWYGRDPFDGRQGLVRIVPRSSGLESEGVPHWWAGGFQSGDVTTIKLSTGSVGGMGRTLTHELTHRFDGAIYRGLPSWIVEGKAVWTGAAYGAPEDEKFIARHVIFGTVESAYLKGYGRAKKLKELIEGTIADYRDNYVAGYALYVYLDSWRTSDDAEPLYRKRLRTFLAEGKPGRHNDLKRFVKSFADGKKGRPDGIAAFAKEWAAFLKGFYWQSRADWLSRYTQKRPRARGRGRRGYIYDGPTWHRDRVRAEPWFGQDQARRAGLLLLAEGRKKEGVIALTWALEVDEWNPLLAKTLGEHLAANGAPEAAWVLQAEVARREGRETPAPPPAIRRRLTKTFTLLKTLAEARAAAKAARRPVTAGAIAVVHDRLAEPLGAPGLEPKLAPDVVKDCLHPLDPPARPLGSLPLVEDRLTDYEERRVAGLWYADEAGDIHVGRKKPRKGTGTVDRRAVQRDAFVRSGLWLSEGSYEITTRIHLTTSYVSGALVIGYGRRDRHLRLGFTAGDFLYSVGAKDEAKEIESVRVSLRGLRERDGALWGAAPRRNVRFSSPRSSFRVRVLVDGATAHAWIEDEFLGSYRSPDGLPIAGYVGFASGHGAWRAQNPSVRRRDRSARLDSDPTWPRGLDPRRDVSEGAWRLRNRLTANLPRTESGSVFVWIPSFPADDDEERKIDAEHLGFIARSLGRSVQRAVRRTPVSQPIHMVVPSNMGKEAVASLTAELKEEAPAIASVLTHELERSLGERVPENGPPRPTTAVLFVDPHGVLRVIETWEGGGGLPPSLLHWTRVYEARANSRGDAL